MQPETPSPKRERRPLSFLHFVRLACFAARPTSRLPGDEGKIRLLALRRRLRLPLFVQGDAGMDRESELLGARSNGPAWSETLEAQAVAG